MKGGKRVVEEGGWGGGGRGEWRGRDKWCARVAASLVPRFYLATEKIHQAFS